MKFVVNMDKDIFNNFVENHPNGHFLQSSEWGEFKSLHDWDMYRVGLLDSNNVVIAAALILSRTIPIINKKILYSPRGFLIDYYNKDLLGKFTKEISDFGKSLGAIFIRIDPYIKHLERDIEGNVIEHGENNSLIIDNLKKLNYKHKGFSLDFNGVQPRFAMRLDISDTIDKVFNSFHNRTRYKIRSAQKKGIEILDGKREDLVKFEEIMKVTGKRDGFITRPLSYFQEMYDILVPKKRMKLFLAKYNIEKGIINLKDDLVKENRTLDSSNKQIEKCDSKEKLEKIKAKITKASTRIEKLNNELKELEVALKENPDGIIVSGTILMITGKTAWYLYGASSNEYRNLMPNHLIQWEMIKWSKENNCTLYDFRGISGDLSPENHLYGLYKFKKGFNTEFTEYIGDFDLVLNKTLHFAWETILPEFKKIRRKLIKR